MYKLINMPKNVKYIIDTLMENKFEAYIVGGCVRDSILNKEPKDWDITTEANPDEVIKLFDKVILTGLKHGTVTVILDKECYEVTTYRTDGDYEDNRHPKEVKFVTSLKEDLARRDFTINAMAYNEEDGLIDYFDGIKDLNNKIIKTVGEPEKRFNEDALRMLRAIRFSAQLNFKIDEKVLKSIKNLKDNINNISKERIREEFNKILLYNPKKIDILRKCEILDYIIPGASKLYNFEQNNPFHIYDLYYHTLLTMELVEPIMHLRLTMLLHDFGKVVTITTDENGVSHFYAHAKESIKAAEKILKELKYDNDTINKILILIEHHDNTFESITSLKIMLNKIGEDLVRDLIKVQWADVLAQNPVYAKERLSKLMKLESQLESILIQKECFNLKDLKINGNDLIKLGVSTGKELGEILKYLLGLVIEEPSLNDHEILINIVKEKLIQ